MHVKNGSLKSCNFVVVVKLHSKEMNALVAICSFPLPKVTMWKSDTEQSYVSWNLLSVATSMQSFTLIGYD